MMSYSFWGLAGLRLGAGLYHHLQASTMAEMLAGNGACNRNCNGKERSCTRICRGAVTEPYRKAATERYRL